MPKTIRNQFDKYLTYENLMKVHRLSRRGKILRREVILFDLKQEEYIQWILEQLKTEKYQHGGYRTFIITVPKERKVQLKLNSKTQIFKSKQGVNFCGYKINEYRLKSRKIEK